MRRLRKRLCGIIILRKRLSRQSTDSSRKEPSGGDLVTRARGAPGGTRRRSRLSGGSVRGDWGGGEVCADASRRAHDRASAELVPQVRGRSVLLLDREALLVQHFRCESAVHHDLLPLGDADPPADVAGDRQEQVDGAP